MKQRLPLILLLTLSACARESGPATPAATTPAVTPATTTPAAAATPPMAAHDEQAADGAVQMPPAGKRWATDAPLRAGMARVRIATTALEPLLYGKMDATQVREKANEIQAAVNAMFAECRLPPQPDAALHPLLAKLLTASQALRDTPNNAAPLAELTAVLTRYPQLFDDKERHR